MRTHKTLHKLYEVAFGELRNAARAAGMSIKKFMTSDHDSVEGKVLRRGTPGAFGATPPRQGLRSFWTKKRNLGVAGNARQRRFARRHPQHF